MPIYGHPVPSGHGRRAPAYRWSPTVLPPSRRRKRRARRAMSPRRGADAPSPLKRAFSAVAGGCAKFLAECPESEGRIPAPVVDILGWLGVLALMSSSGIGLLLGGAIFASRFLEGFHGEALKSCAEDCRKDDSRTCIHRKTSVDGPPSAEELRRAWAAARGSLAGKLWAGKLLSDVEPSVDQSFVRAEDGTIVGRRPGLKGWLRANCPDMLPHYKALMGYKALADKLRKALGIEDPDTLAGVLDFGALAGGNDAGAPACGEGAGAPDGDKDFGGAPDGGKDFGGEARMGAPDTGAGTGAGKRDAGEGIAPKSLAIRKRFKLQNTNEERVIEGIRALFGIEEGNTRGSARPPVPDAPGGPRSMAALDAAVRERLGLLWMQRTGPLCQMG